MIKKLRSIFLMGLGYLLSPLCWWNDIVFNLPIAYGFGWLCHLFTPSFLIPGTIIGYWLSNIIGMLMIQFGAANLMDNQNQTRNVKKELFTGLVSSTLYTLVIIALIQFKILDANSLLSMISSKNS